jgi:tetratricopeptide (TPR) repeat protein
VTIVTYDINREISDLGSGFFVNNHGHLITNYHVLKGAYAADVKTYDGKQYPVEGVVAENEAADLIKVRVNIPEVPIDWVAVTETEPAIGERVLVVGSPLGLEQTVSEGIVSAIRELPVVGKVFQLSAPISPGSSGSPVVNMKGKVVGVVSFQATIGQNLNFAVSSKKVLALKKNETQKALSEWTYDISKRTPKLAEELCRKGFNFSIRGEFKNALIYYKEATEKSPDDTDAWYGLGSCYDGLDKPEEAIAAYKQVIQLDPESAGAYFNLGRYYRKLGRFEEAIHAYNQAIEVNPDHAFSYFDLGTLYSQMEEFENGERAFKEVLRINPEHAPTYYYMGLTYNRLERYQDAIESYKKALENNPGSAPVLYSLGIAYGSLGKSLEEVEAFKLAIRIDPDFAPAHYNMGLIYLKNGNKAAALEEYKILKRLDTGTAEMLFLRIY